jgi:hypothetical protein
MGNIFKIIFYGKGIERFRAFTIIYMAFINCCICSNILRKYYRLVYVGIDSNNITNEVIKFILSPYSVVVILTFLIISCITYFSSWLILTLLFKTFLRKIFYIPIYILGLIVNIILFRFKNIFKNVHEKTVSINMKSIIVIIFRSFISQGTDGKWYKKKAFKRLKSNIQEINSSDEIEIGIQTILTLLTATYVCIYQYDLFSYSPILYGIIKYTFYYWLLNNIIWKLAFLEKDFLFEIMTNYDVLEYVKIEDPT